MGPYEDLFRERPGDWRLGESFEQQVMGKIRRKKRQRRQTLALSLGLLLVIGGGAWYFATADKAHDERPAPMLVETRAMEEIPLLEEVTVRANTGQTEYPVEWVSLQGGAQGL